MRLVSVEQFFQSPSRVLRPCAALAEAHQPVAQVIPGVDLCICRGALFLLVLSDGFCFWFSRALLIYLLIC